MALARLDPRSGALFGAAWVLGNVAAFAHAGVDAISVLGLGMGEGLLLVQADRLHLSPAGFVLRELGAAVGMRPVSISHTDRIAALAWDHGSGSALLVANLSSDVTNVETGAWPIGMASIMDAASWISHAADGRTDPWRPVDLLPGGLLRLPAYAIARLGAATGSAA